MGDPRGIIAAVSPEGAIGVNGKIPWHYRGDLKRVKRVTMGSTLIMGRVTWETLGGKPLPGRRNLVVTGHDIPGVETFRSLGDALRESRGPVWFFGGARIYEEAMAYADVLDIVYVPDHVEGPGVVYFPRIDPQIWQAGPLVPLEDEPALTRREFRRITALET
ncbi:MAG TPA: dihydrofolate reductase [Polyangiaceae bacterium]|jgi:dihydrofolate reductase